MREHKQTVEEVPTGTAPTPGADSMQLELLHRRYGTFILRTAYLMMGSWPEAEDVAQEVWMLVARNLDRYDPARGSWRTWLYKITSNRCMTVKRRLLHWVDKQLPLLEHHAEAPQPLERVLRQEEQLQIWQAVQHLSLKLRVIVALRYYHGLSYEEIATILECPIGTVRSRLNAAHAKLHSLLKEPL